MRLILVVLVLTLSTPLAGAKPRVAACTMETRGEAAGPVLYSTDYFVDAQGRLAVTQVRDERGVLSREVYTRDRAHRVIRKCGFRVQDRTELPEGCTKLRYAGEARTALSSTDITADGTVVATTTFTFDPQGRETQRRLERADGAVVIQSRAYTPRGQLDTITLTDSANGAETEVFRHSYSKTGELERQTLEVVNGKDTKLAVIRTYVKPCTTPVLDDGD